MKDKFWNIRQNEEAVSMDLFGEMGGWGEEGFDENSFLKEFREIDPKAPLNITINSPGGSVQTGLSIYGLLLKHEGPINIYVAGWACSAATLITCVPNATVTVSRGSFMMIHRVSGVSMGNAEDLKKSAGVMEQLEGMILGIYAQKTGRSEEELREKMHEETYFTALEAVDYGFADIYDDDHAVVATMDNGRLFVNSVQVGPDLIKDIPQAIVDSAVSVPAEDEGIQWVYEQEKVVLTNQAEEEEEPMDLEKLKSEYPDLVSAICKEGAKAERNRIRSLEEVGLKGFENLLNEAKYDGVSTAADLSMKIIAEMKSRQANMASMRELDAQEVNSVPPSRTDSLDTTAQTSAFIEAARNAFKR